jgi:hypothetical protein
MKLNLVTLFVCLIASTLSYAQSLRDKTMDILRKHDVDAYEMIVGYEKYDPNVYDTEGSLVIQLSPPSDWTFYIEGESDGEIVRSLNTAVHETAHSYFSNMVYKYLQANNLPIDFSDAFIYNLHYFDKDHQLVVKATPNFPSEEFADEVPTHLRGGRYELYIAPSKELRLSTQTSGIYGLLDEWNAYFLGTRTSYRMYDYFKAQEGNEIKKYFQYLAGVESTLYGIMEFKYFVLHYLDYARRHHNDLYLLILNNRSFKKAFKEIDQRSQQLYVDYDAKKQEIVRELKDKGFIVEVTDNYLMVNGKMQGMFIDEFKRFASEIEKPYLKKIEAKIYGRLYLVEELNTADTKEN